VRLGALELSASTLDLREVGKARPDYAGDRVGGHTATVLGCGKSVETIGSFCGHWLLVLATINDSLITLFIFANSLVSALSPRGSRRQFCQTGREPAMRISTSLLALCCQSGPELM
jgi:hypothetical protein